MFGFGKKNNDVDQLRAQVKQIIAHGAVSESTYDEMLEKLSNHCSEAEEGIIKLLSDAVNDGVVQIIPSRSARRTPRGM